MTSRLLSIESGRNVRWDINHRGRGRRFSYKVPGNARDHSENRNCDRPSQQNQSEVGIVPADVRSDDITECHKCHGGDEAAEIREAGEYSQPQTRSTSHISQEVPQPWNERTHDQYPSAPVLETMSRPRDLTIINGKYDTVPSQKKTAGASAQHEARCKSGDASYCRNRYCGIEGQDVVKCQVAADNEQPFIGDGQADDAENKKNKETEVAVGRDALHDGVLGHAKMFAGMIPLAPMDAPVWKILVYLSEVRELLNDYESR